MNSNILGKQEITETIKVIPTTEGLSALHHSNPCSTLTSSNLISIDASPSCQLRISVNYSGFRLSFRSQKSPTCRRVPCTTYIIGPNLSHCSSIQPLVNIWSSDMYPGPRFKWSNPMHEHPWTPLANYLLSLSFQVEFNLKYNSLFIRVQLCLSQIHISFISMGPFS